MLFHPFVLPEEDSDILNGEQYQTYEEDETLWSIWIPKKYFRTNIE